MASIVEELVGAEVSQVVFVRDYVQIGLEIDTDEPATGGGYQSRHVGITTVADPEVSMAGRTFSNGDPGWRDALCELIDSRVRAVLVADVEFRVEFDTDAVLTVSLRGNPYSPESVLVDGLGTWVF